MVGSTLYHRLECRTAPPFTVAVLFFQPDLIRADGSPDCAEYLTPFLLQDSQFPHIIPAKTRIPNQGFGLMQRIRAELPARLEARRCSWWFRRTAAHLATLRVWCALGAAEFRIPAHAVEGSFELKHTVPPGRPFRRRPEKPHPAGIQHRPSRFVTKEARNLIDALDTPVR